MLIKDGKQRRKGEQKTAEDRKGKTFANKLPFVAWTLGWKSLIKIIRDGGQRRKGHKTVRSEKCLGGWEQMGWDISQVIECRDVPNVERKLWEKLWFLVKTKHLLKYKHWDGLKQNKTKVTDSEDLDAVLHPVVSSTRLFQHAHHHYFRTRQHETQQRRNNWRYRQCSCHHQFCGEYIVLWIVYWYLPNWLWNWKLMGSPLTSEHSVSFFDFISLLP